MKPLLSLIIPVYNAERHLSRCVDSILSQSYSNLDIILIDDGSTDKSGEICDQYIQKDTRIQVIHNKNQGVSVARNIGIKKSKGDYIGFVDADDWVDPTMCSYLLNLCLRHKTLVSVCEYYGNRHTPLYHQEKVITTREWMLHPKMIASVWAKLFSKSLITSHQFNTTITIGEDSLFNTQLLTTTTHIAYGPLPQYHYLQHEDSAMNRPFNASKLTYFKAVELEQACLHSKQWFDVEKKFRCNEASAAAALLRQIIQSNCQDTHKVEYLRNILKRRIGEYMLSNYKLSSRLFALVCCVNFKLACRLYKLLKG